MLLVEALAVLALTGVLVYVLFATLTGASRRRDLVAGDAVWQATHTAARGVTRIVVRKVAGGEVAEEHLIAEIRDDDPEYEARFLEAMAKARARAALFEAEG